MPKRVVLLVVSAMLALPGIARASSITFLGAAPTTGTIFYAGGATPLVGSNISLDLVVGTDTPLNDGGAALCLTCVLNFTSGNFVTGDATAWIFDEGGSFSIVGGLDLTGDGVQNAGDIPAGTTLMQGVFSGLQFTLADNAPLFNGLQLSFISTVLDPALVAYYGFSPATPDAIMFATFAGVGTAPGPFVSSELNNIVVSAPEPASMLLMLTGFAGALYRRRRAA